jgi:GT2 family glycosyltransferase
VSLQKKAGMEEIQDILIIGVIYNTYPEAVRYLESTESFRKAGALVTVVDNSDKPTSKPFSAYLQNNPEVSYIHSGSNTGYFHGASTGLDQYVKSKGRWPLWTLVTNVDIVFTDPEALIKIRDLDSIPNMGVVGPSIISSLWGTDFNPQLLKRYTRGKMIFYRTIYSSLILSNLYQVLSYIKKFVRGRKKINHDPPGTGLQEIYGPHGACLFFHRNYFSRGGTLNHISFLFGEEIFVAETVIKIGLKAFYDPRIKIADHEHASTGTFLSFRINALILQSLRDIVHNYYPKR